MIDGDEDSDEDENNEEPELDKQMGDLGKEDTDKLDEQIWGSDDEEDPEESDVCSQCVCYLFRFYFRS